MTLVGQTLGVEEEYHLVDATTGALADAPHVVQDAARLLTGEVQGEISTSQLEVVTPVSTSLSEVRAHLVRLRRGVAQVAAGHGCAVLAAGWALVLPLACDGRQTDSPSPSPIKALPLLLRELNPSTVAKKP